MLSDEESRGAKPNQRTVWHLHKGSGYFVAPIRALKELFQVVGSFPCIRVFLALAVAAGSCARVGKPDIEPDSGMDADTDADTDTEIDTDADTDSGVDPYECAGGRLDPSSGLCWQHPMASGTYHWQEAVDYCDNLELAGHSDWYLPDRTEFMEFLGGCDEGALKWMTGICDSCADSEKCTALFASDTGFYWTSSRFQISWDYSWAFDFANGHVLHVLTVGNLHCRCVRVEQ